MIYQELARNGLCLDADIGKQWQHGGYGKYRQRITMRLWSYWMEDTKNEV